MFVISSFQSFLKFLTLKFFSNYIFLLIFFLDFIFFAFFYSRASVFFKKFIIENFLKNLPCFSLIKKIFRYFFRLRSRRKEKISFVASFLKKFYIGKFALLFFLFFLYSLRKDLLLSFFYKYFYFINFML